MDDLIKREGPLFAWLGNQADKFYHQSGSVSSTLKTSQDISGVDTSPRGISADETNVK